VRLDHLLSGACTCVTLPANAWQGSRKHQVNHWLFNFWPQRPPPGGTATDEAPSAAQAAFVVFRTWTTVVTRPMDLTEFWAPCAALKERSFCCRHLVWEPRTASRVRRPAHRVGTSGCRPPGMAVMIHRTAVDRILENSIASASIFYGKQQGHTVNA